jgi:ADP-ribose pyrophosphatase
MPLALRAGRLLFDGMNPSSPAPGLPRWERSGQSVQARTRVFDLLAVQYRHPRRGLARDFTVIQAPDWVNVIARTADDHLVLVRQFRYGIDAFSLEIPGGIIEAGEDPVAAGVRELQEETGYTGGTARLIGSVHPNPAIQSNRSHFVLVEPAVKSHELAWDADEEIEVARLPTRDVFELARNGGITHGLVLNALWFFEPHWRGTRSLKA